MTPATTRPYARTNAEAHLFMDLHPCGCGSAEFERHSAVITEGGALCSRYAGPCRSCGAQRVFVFELPDEVRPIRSDEVDFGGPDPSRLLDPGEWLAVADEHAKRNPGTRRDLDIARAAVEEVLRFIPADAERVPDDAFHSERGRAVCDREPGRFRRVRLEAVSRAYRELLAKTPSSVVNGTGGAPEAPLPSPPGAAPPVPALDRMPVPNVPNVPNLIEAFASAIVKRHGFEGLDLRRLLADFQGQVQTLVKLFDIKAKEEQQRQRTTAEVERLLEGIARTGTSAGETIAAHRDEIARAFQGVNLAQIADGLQVLSQWLRNPTDASGASVQQMIASLQQTMQSVATPATPADEERASEIRAEVRASIDQMFRGGHKNDS